MVFGSELNNFDNGRYIGGGQTQGGGGGGGNDNGDGGGNDENNGGENVASRLQALRAASCIKVLGKGVIRVVKRVDAARESNKLGEFESTSAGSWLLIPYLYRAGRPIIR